MSADGVTDALSDLILTPGNGHKVVPIINAALIALMTMLLYCAFKWSAIAAHLYAMVALALGLLLSVNWFSAELRKEAKRS